MAARTSITTTKRRRRGALCVAGLVAVTALLLVACDPEPAPAPDPLPETTTSTSTTTTTGIPQQQSICQVIGAEAPAPTATPANPVDYMVLTENANGEREVHTFTATSEADKNATVQQIGANSNVIAVEPNTQVNALAIDDPVYLGPPASPFGPQWGVDKVKFEAAWGPGLNQGAGVRVAVIDTGVQADHQDLGRKENGGNVVAGQDFLADSVVGDERTDSGVHGTHVAGILGALDNTVGGIGGAPDVTIVPVRVLNSGSGTISDVVSGILWAANPAEGNADVINLSLGGGCSQSEYDALSYAVSQGVTVVAAGGNDGTSGTKLFPAAFSSVLNGVIAVAATTSTDARASFSTVASYITIAAPGEGITSTLPAGNNSYGNLSGTSMASPVVAATAALVKAKCPAYTPAQVSNRLTSTAVDLGPAGRDTSFGYGLVRADLAVAAAC